tara:strand:- start:1593 stop:1817 length:225 start_codon:yes stop_codon:yes gene_type:complete
VHSYRQGTKKNGEEGEHFADDHQMTLRNREVKSIISQVRINYFYAARPPVPKPCIDFSALANNLYRLAFPIRPA